VPVTPPAAANRPGYPDAHRPRWPARGPDRDRPDGGAATRIIPRPVPVRPAGARRTAALALAAAVIAGAAACGTPGSPAPAARPSPDRFSGSSAPSAQSIPSALLSQARPVGVGASFHPPASGPVAGACTSSLGPRDGVHVEVFAVNRVLLLPAGIGVRAPLASLDGRITRARCYGALVTLDPTGVVLVRPGAALTLGALFRSWGVPLSRTRLASFTAPAGTAVTVFVDGRPWPGPAAAVPLTQHAEIVLEVGPHVPPHSSYAFPPGT
jgi:hypothetical protein